MAGRQVGSKPGWTRSIAVLAVLMAGSACMAVAADTAALQVTLSNGFKIVCDHRAWVGDRVRLYLEPGSQSFMEVAGVEIASVDAVPAPNPGPDANRSFPVAAAPLPDPTPAQLRGMMSRAGVEHNVDVDLLASVVRAESGGNIRAVSRAGARGLMQLMPATAAQLGASDSPEQNINGGTAYLDGLLTRYHDDIRLALAAYNAGPGAVDRYRAIPPYHETRAYVNRVIHEFNRRKSLAAREVAAASRTASPAESASGNRIQ